MAHWEIRSLSGTVEVECANWLVAVSEGLPLLGHDEADVSDLVCDIQPDGVVRIHDPRSTLVLLLRQLDAADRAAPDAAESEQVLASDLSESQELAPQAVHAAGPPADSLADQAQAEHTWQDEASSDTPPPAIELPRPALASEFSRPVPQLSLGDGFDDDDLAFFDSVSSEVDDGPPDDIGEKLFILGEAVADASSIEEAADAALGALLSVVEAESAAVLYAHINDTGLRFLAARGPSADQVKDLQVPFGHGIAGFIHDMGAGIIVQDAGHDPRHHSEVDAATGYTTDAILACAIRDVDGGIHGCIELLNPPGRFQPWHLDAARSVATTLADVIRVRG